MFAIFVFPPFSTPLEKRQINFVTAEFNFLDGHRYHIETSPLICRADQWTGFYMITAPS